MRNLDFFAFAYVLLCICMSEALLLVLMLGGHWQAFSPMLLFVTPALLAGVDLWHFVSDRLPRRDQKRSEFKALARFIFCWLLTSVPATVVLIIIHRAWSEILGQIHSNFDCWILSLSILIWHGFLSSPLIVRGQKAFSVGYFVSWMKELSQTNPAKSQTQ